MPIQVAVVERYAWTEICHESVTLLFTLGRVYFPIPLTANQTARGSYDRYERTYALEKRPTFDC